MVQVNLPDKEVMKKEDVKVLGIDRGVKNIAVLRISKNSSILPDLVRINFIHERAMKQHGKPS